MVAVVLVLLGIGGRGDPETGPGTGTPEPSTSGASLATPTSAVRPDPETWCRSFRTFTEASTRFVATPEDAQATVLVEAGQALLAEGQPLGLSDGGMASLRQLVAGSLGEAGGPTEGPTDVEADGADLDAYLQATCPA